MVLGFSACVGGGTKILLEEYGGRSPPMRDSLNDVDIDIVNYPQYFYHSRDLSSDAETDI